MTKKTAKKQRKPKPPRNGGGKGGGDSFLGKIPGLIKDVASIGSIVSTFMGTPMGAQTGSRGAVGSFTNKRASQLVTAPATAGLLSRTPNWDFGRAPDMGYGPGIRVSGRLILAEVVGSVYEVKSTPEPSLVRVIGASPNAGSLVDGELKIDDAPQSFMILSPVCPFQPGSNAGDPQPGTFGSPDNIIQAVGQCFQRYNVVDATLVYAPTVGSSDQHTIVIAWVPDPGIILNYAGVQVVGDTQAPQPLADPNFAMSIPNSVTFQSWCPTTFTIPLDKRTKRDLLYVNDTTVTSVSYGDNADPTTACLEARQLFEGGFVITGFGVDSADQAMPAVYTLGTMFLDLTIDLYQMAMDEAPPVYGTTVPGPETKSVTSIPRPLWSPFFPRPRPMKPRSGIHSWVTRKYRRHLLRMPAGEDAQLPARPTSLADFVRVRAPELDGRMTDRPWIPDSPGFGNAANVVRNCKTPSLSQGAK
jgi:hypothetical protein